MSEENGEEARDISQPVPAANLAPLIPDYSNSPLSPMGSEVLTLRTLPLMEAELARAKLESEGIRCFVTDQSMAAIHPLVFKEVRLQVLATDAIMAEEILSRPPPDDNEGEYADEAFRCPKCHRRNVDLLPLSERWRRIRIAWVVLLAMPFLLRMLEWLIGEPDFARRLGDIESTLVLPWLMTCAALGAWLLLLRRDKRCRDCGWQWGREQKMN